MPISLFQTAANTLTHACFHFYFFCEHRAFVDNHSRQNRKVGCTSRIFLVFSWLSLILLTRPFVWQDPDLQGDDHAAIDSA